VLNYSRVQCYYVTNWISAANKKNNRDLFLYSAQDPPMTLRLNRSLIA